MISVPDFDCIDEISFDFFINFLHIFRYFLQNHYKYYCNFALQQNKMENNKVAEFTLRPGTTIRRTL